MYQPTKRFLTLLLVALFLSLGWGIPSFQPAAARPNLQPAYASAYELINAVNALRAQNGLPPYFISSILMQTAQSQADYNASIGYSTHTGPGGSSVTDRLLAAGYPLAGDLSLGGFRAENILSASPNASGADIVNSSGWADSLHQNTMLSANLAEIGAGVAVSGGTAYYVIDCARPTDEPIAYTPPAMITLTPFNPGTIVPTHGIIIPNTPAADGSIKYTVQDGDTLFTISIAYRISVDDLKRLNRLTTNLIYVGDVLIIRTTGPRLTPTVTETSTPAPTFTPFVFWTVTSSPTLTATPIPSAPVAGGSGTIVVGVIVVAALVLAGVLTASGTRKRES